MAKKIELTQRQLEFVGGYVFGHFARAHHIPIDGDNLEAVEQLVSQALARLFPVSEAEALAELDEYLQTV